MILKELIKDLDILSIKGDLNLEINDISINSKKVTKNSIYIALNGTKHNGNKFIQEVVDRGCKCIISENDISRDVTLIKVKNARKSYSLISKNFYKKACEKLKFIFVIGTNGKSTTAYLVHEILKRNSIKSALIGSMYIEWNDVRIDSTFTTPDPDEMHKLFYIFLKEKIDIVVMEVSAHAIDLYKVYGINPTIKIFTNFSQDHLDYFHCIENYRQCKKEYILNEFSNKSESSTVDHLTNQKEITSIQVLNVDDDLGRELYNESNSLKISYGLENPSDVFALDVEFISLNTKFLLNVCDQITEINTKLFGMFNVYNLLASISAVSILGIGINEIKEALKNINPPQGRFNLFLINEVKIIVDFAHTPDGLYNVLKEINKMDPKRIITVFGCGGDRDITKRNIMGRIAKSMSDIVILTSDNPRSEDENSIIEDIMQGIKNKENVYVVLNRRDAIDYSYKISKPGDVILIAGKGAENYFEKNNVKYPYSDIEEVKKLGSYN